MVEKHPGWKVESTRLSNCEMRDVSQEYVVPDSVLKDPPHNGRGVGNSQQQGQGCILLPLPPPSIASLRAGVLYAPTGRSKKYIDTAPPGVTRGRRYEQEDRENDDQHVT